jgi:hypothetical protein
VNEQRSVLSANDNAKMSKPKLACAAHCGES